MASEARTWRQRSFPTSSFEEALVLIDGIWKYASGDEVFRLTLLNEMKKSPTSSATRALITNSGKYGITSGSFNARTLTPTDLGKKASDPNGDPREKLKARFQLAIENIPAFKRLYDQYAAKRLPTHEVMKDTLRQSDLRIPSEQEQECLDIFIVNAKFLGLLQTIGGSETLLTVEEVLGSPDLKTGRSGASLPDGKHVIASASTKWQRICFYIAPIGEEGSEQRKHSDMFLHALIEPALKEFDLEVVRADAIGEPGMITSQLLEYIMKSRLTIVDLSFQNPNAFYEMCFRHCCQLPVVQITRREDKLPFDVGQVRTVTIDTTDIYTFVPKLETYRSEIATQIRAALSGSEPASNPISVFFPQVQPLALKGGAA